ncbi:MAG: alpha-2-macroglobulin family protein, partial [Burkholderiales bacterium]|nr:alpha-2-macroglobulin family protein [Burkholderiales bacterium]
MDILRLIIRLPFLIAGIIYGFLWALFGFLSFLFKPIIGDISWECPLWLSMLIRGGKRLETFSERHPKAIAAGTLGVIVAGFAAYATYLWVESRPRPIEVAPIGKNEIVAEVRAPMATDYTQEPLSFPRLQLRFSESAAPTEKIGKAITEGIVLLPEKKGTWQWSDDQTLTFTPEDDWKIEEPYKITLETQKLLAEQVTLHQTVYTFNTAPFTVSVPESELYQNPDKPSEKNAVFKVKFSHPVDAASFEKRVGLSLQTVEKQHTLNKSFPFAIKYDQKKLTAWVRSGLVTLPDVDSEMKLTIAEGVTSTLPGKAGKTKVSMAQTVLGAYQNIVKNIEPTFAENDRNEVTQILAVSLMDAVNPKTFAPHIKAWVFPENYNRLYINEDALQDAIPLSLELENPSTAESTLAFKYKADPKRYIYVKVDKDIETVGGYKAKSASYFATSVPHFPQVLRFANQGAVLPLIGDKKIGVLARGLNGVQLEIKRVIPNQLHHLFPMSWDDQFAKKHFDSIAGQENHFVERFTVNRSLDNASPVKSQYIGFNLSDFLLKKGKHGVFLLSLNAWDAKNNKVTGIGFDNKLVIVTDLGLITKEATDKSLDVFVQSIHQNKPKKGVSVSVVAQNGSTLVSGKTNDEGHIAFPSLAHYRYEQTPAMVLADDNGDISLLPAYFYTGDRELDFSRFDVGGADNETRAGKLNAYVFSDRGLYRPGDRVNIGMIVRAESWSIPVGGVPLKVTVYDPRGETFGESFIEVDKTGFNEFNFTTPDSAPTGDWIISLSLARDTRKGGYVNSEYTTLGTGKVSVREFTPDRMKVQLVFQGDTTQGWVKPEALKATLLAHNLFGTPAQNRVVTSKLIAQPTQFIFKEFAGYSFYDAAYHPDRQFEITLENTKTDAEGKAPLALHLEEHERASYRLSIFAEAFEAGAGRGVATTQSVYVSPNDYMIGAKPDGETAYINQKDKRALHFIAVNPDLRTRALEGLTIDLIEKKYVSVLTLQDSGIYKYQSKLREIPVRSEPLAIAQGGTNVALDTQKPGLYMLVVKNDKNDILYKSDYRVAGVGNIDRSLTRSAELNVKLSKNEYQSGDTIELAIDAPYTGTGLITIEKDKVYAWKWFHTKTTGTVQKITVPKNLKGNGYVNVQFIRGGDSDELFLSPLSYSVQPFKVKAVAETASLKIDAPKLIKPGEPMKISVTTTEPQKLVVYAVDEGILQVADYRFMNPLAYFFEKRRLQVKSFQIIDLIMPDFARFERLVSAAGGDELVAKNTLANQLNPFKRKVEKPVVYWSEMIEVKGKKTLSYTPPDYFNGTLRVMAVSVSENKIGAAQTQTTVRDDFVLTPNAPFVMSPGDQVDVTLNVSNNVENNGQSVPVAVTLVASPQLQVVGASTATLTLPEKAEDMARFTLKANEVLGNGTLQCKASDKDNPGKRFDTTRQATISVRTAMPALTQTLMRRMSGDS